jgi:predicted TIM-barrel fold metal-dependent hydrolase
MRIADTHQDLWDLDRFRYAWVSSQPRLNRSFPMQDYLAATAGLDVVQSVHVEADVDER